MPPCVDVHVFVCSVCVSLHSPVCVTLLYCRCVRRGIHDLKLWPGVVADGNIKTTTPGKPDGKSITEMNRLTKVTTSTTLIEHSGFLQLAKKHNKGRLSKIDWLDRLAFREIELINEVSIQIMM